MARTTTLLCVVLVMAAVLLAGCGPWLALLAPAALGGGGGGGGGGKNTPPTTSGIASVADFEDATNRVIALRRDFDDAEDGSAGLTYSVEANSNPGLFDSVSISSSDVLTLDYRADQNGFATITVRATDSAGASVEDAFTVTVTAVNDVPLISTPGAQTGVEDTPDTITIIGIQPGPATATDEAGQTVTLSVTSTNPGLFQSLSVGSVSSGSATLSYTTATDANGSATITVSADDGQIANATTPIQFVLTVYAVNDAPFVVGGGIPDETVLEDAVDSVIDLRSFFGDIEDSSDLNYTVVTTTSPGLFASFAINGTTDVLTLDYAANQNGTAAFTIRATDNGDGASPALFVEQSFTVTILSAPRFTSSPVLTATENMPYTYTATVTGNPTPTLTATGTAGTALPGWLSFNPATGELTGMPSSTDVGAHGVQITAANGVPPDAVQAFTITVTSAAAGGLSLTDISPVFGVTGGGTRTTLIGSGFGSGTSTPPVVSFGGLLATHVVVVSSTTIRCTAPLGAVGSVGVSVSTALEAATLPASFTYFAQFDLNADGLEDLIASKETGSEVYVFFGSPAFSGADAALADVIFTENNNEGFGISLTADDVNGDGTADLLVGAPTHRGGTDLGRVYIFFGGPGLASVDASAADVIITGSTMGARFGDKVATGDVNGDGVADVIANGGGSVHVFFGGGTSLTGSTTDTAADVKITPAGAGGLGSWLAAGDLDDNGIMDLVIGSNSGTGNVFVFRGGAGLATGTSADADITISGASGSTGVGGRLAVGDFDGDGVDDLVASALEKTFIILGGSTLQDLNAANANAVLTANLSGFVAAGDVTGDGIDDIIASDVAKGGLAGEAYVFFGGLPLRSRSSAEADVTVIGLAAQDTLGSSVGAIDVDADGIRDLLVGASEKPRGGVGHGYIFRGSVSVGSRLASDADFVMNGSTGSRFQLITGSPYRRTRPTGLGPPTWRLDASVGTSVGLSGVWGVDNSDVFVVGDAGTILHFDGSAWSVHNSGTTEPLSDVWGTRGDNVYAVGLTDTSTFVQTLLHYDGVSWTFEATGESAHLRAVHGTSPSDVWVVGDAGHALHFDGALWTAINAPTANGLFGVFGVAPDAVWAVGNLGTIVHFNGAAWATQDSGVSGDLIWDVWGGTPIDVFAVRNGLLQFDGSLWATTTPSSPPVDGHSIAGNSLSNIFAVAPGGRVFHFDGQAWSEETTGTTENLESVWISPSGRVYAVGANGTVLVRE